MRAERERAGLSQAAVAEALGCSQANVSHIEAGRSRISTDQLRLFSALVGVPASSLLGERKVRR